MTAKRTWVLGGGGARGAAQVGALLALFEAGVDPPERVIGTSVGALNGAAICAYPSLAGARRIVAISLMAGAEQEQAPTNLGSIIALTLQLSLHHQMLSDLERLRGRADITVLCPVTPPTATWEMRRAHVEDVIERSRRS